MSTLEDRVKLLEETVADLGSRPDRYPQMLAGRKGFIQNGRRVQLHPKQMLFIHNPKTAGRTISQWFRQRLNYHVHMSALELKQRVGKAFEEVFSFAFVRHPYARFLSAFNFAKAASREAMDPNEFCRQFAASKMDWIPKYHIHHPEHFLTQCFYILGEEGEILPLKVYRYEDLKHALIDLENRGLEDATKMPVHLGESNDWANILTEESRKIIKAAYACDFDLYERIPNGS